MYLSNNDRAFLYRNRRFPVQNAGLRSYLSADTPTEEKTGFLSFSSKSIIGDISFLLLCGVGVALIWPSIGPLGQKLRGVVSK